MKESSPYRLILTERLGDPFAISRVRHNRLPFDVSFARLLVSIVFGESSRKVLDLQHLYRSRPTPDKTIIRFAAPHTLLEFDNSVLYREKAATRDDTLQQPSSFSVSLPMATLVVLRLL
jgi:hypothetical protein